jgi:alpha-beta hydrolase superfamily lysophospholipase
MKPRIPTPYGKVKLYRPNTDNEQERVMVVPGFSESLTHNKKLVDTLARIGFDAFTFTQPRRRGKTGLTDPIDRQGDIVLKLLETTLRPNDRVHAVAHSLGCAAVLKAAMQHPERFASLTLMQPLGMVGEQGFGEQLKRVSKKVTRNQVAATLEGETRLRYSARVARAQLAGGGIIARHPRLAIQEARAAGKYDIADDIKDVVQLGVPVHVVTANSDEMFDRHKIATGYELISDSVTSYSNIADQAAPHDTFWLHPERTAKLISQIIHER